MKNTILTFLLVALCGWVSAQQNYTFGTRHSDGLVSIYYTYSGNAAQSYKTQYRYGLYDEVAKRIVVPMQFNILRSSNEKDLFIVEDTLKRWGIYSVKLNNFIVTPEYSEIKSFSEGLAVVSKTNGGKWKYGAVDKTGKLVIPLEYAQLGTYSEGLICFSREKGYGFMDKQGKEIIPPLYRSLSTFKEGLACVSLLDSTNYGYINRSNQWVISPKYLRGNEFQGNYALVFTTRNYAQNSDNGGIIDKTGKVIVPLEYDYINIYRHFFVVKKSTRNAYASTNTNKYGILSLNGHPLLPAEYDDIIQLTGTPYYRTYKNQRYQLIDSTTKPVTAEYEYIYSFNDDGLTYLKKENKYTIVNKALKTIIPETEALNVLFSRNGRVALVHKHKVDVYDATGKLLQTIAQENIATYGTDFTGGGDSIKITYKSSCYLYHIPTGKRTLLDYTEVSDFNEDGIFLGKNTFYEFVDINGAKLSPKTYASVINFSEGIAAVQEGSYSTPYLVDKTFRKISDLYNVFEGPYSEGLAKAKAQYGGVCYYYDKKGNHISVTSCSGASEFRQGRAYVKDQYSGKFYYIDRQGKKINSEVYEDAGPFSDGLAGVKKNGAVGFIDTTGKALIPFQFDAASGFYNGIAMVKKGNEFYLINKKGEKSIKEVYNGAKNPEKGSFPVQKGVNYGLIDEKGKVVVDFKYEDITPMQEGIAWAKKDGKWGLVNASGKAITPFEYDSGNNCTNGYIKAEKNKKAGLLDKSGKVVIPFEYDNMGNAFQDKVLLKLNSGVVHKAIK